MSDQLKSRIEYPFVIIPAKIYEINMSPIELAVLTRIIFRAGRLSSCFESKASIAAACEISVRRLSDALELLEEAKIIEVESGKSKGKTNTITVTEPAQWLCIVQKTTKPKGRYAPDADLGRQDVPTRWAPRADITISLEPDPIEQDSFLKDIASDPVAAPEVIESEVVFDGVPQQMASRKEVQTKSLTTSMTSTTKDSLSPTMNAWRGYSEAFYAKYKVEPQRNARVMGQLKKFVEFVGSADAPEILRFYLTCNDQWYVKNMHSVGIALSQAEKLAAGYRGARVFTTKEAQQIDSMQTSQNIVDDFYNNLEAHGYAQEGNS